VPVGGADVDHGRDEGDLGRELKLLLSPETIEQAHDDNLQGAAFYDPSSTVRPAKSSAGALASRMDGALRTALVHSAPA
jgi:hypothetical protein